MTYFKDFKTYISEEFNPMDDKVQFISKEELRNHNFGWETKYGDEAIGSFAHMGAGGSDYTIFRPDKEVQKLARKIPLKPSQFIARTETETSKIGGMRPIVLIDLKKERIYFQEDLDNENLEFSRKGSKIRYLTIRKEWVENHVK